MMRDSKDDMNLHEIMVHRDLLDKQKFLVEKIRQESCENNYIFSIVNNENENVMLYFLYEYSDTIQLIYENPQYPSMLNYVKTGLLTEEEIVQVLLHE